MRRVAERFHKNVCLPWGSAGEGHPIPQGRRGAETRRTDQGYTHYSDLAPKGLLATVPGDLDVRGGRRILFLGGRGNGNMTCDDMCGTGWQAYSC